MYFFLKEFCRLFGDNEYFVEQQIKRKILPGLGCKPKELIFNPMAVFHRVLGLLRRDSTLENRHFNLVRVGKREGSEWDS